jgi:hypothetical protein
MINRLAGALLLLAIAPLGCGARSAPTGDSGGDVRRDARADARRDGRADARRDGGVATFTCQPLPSTARGCDAPDTTWGKAGVPGAKYPVGCEVIYPFPHPYYPSGPATCSCEESPLGGQPGWSCPL